MDKQEHEILLKLKSIGIDANERKRILGDEDHQKYFIELLKHYCKDEVDEAYMILAYDHWAVPSTDTQYTKSRKTRHKTVFSAMETIELFLDSLNIPSLLKETFEADKKELRRIVEGAIQVDNEMSLRKYNIEEANKILSEKLGLSERQIRTVKARFSQFKNTGK